MIFQIMKPYTNRQGKKDGWTVTNYIKGQYAGEGWTAGGKRDAQQMAREMKLDLIRRMIDAA